MFEILLHRQAKKAYEQFPVKAARFINRAFTALEHEPTHGPNIKRLHGELDGLHRLRVGDYRIVYQIDIEKKRVLVFAIGQRGHSY